MNEWQHDVMVLGSRGLAWFGADFALMNLGRNPMQSGLLDLGSNPDP